MSSSPSEAGPQRGSRRVVALWFALACLCFLAAWEALGAPGMFYDEAWLAQQARRFVDPERPGLHAPGAITGWLFGRPFPLFALPYLGSVKSQLLIPFVFVFGNEVAVTRLATVAFVALAFLFTLLWTRRVLGERSAWIAAPLLAADPTVFFSSQLEWGPFSTGFLFRALGLWLVTDGWLDRSRTRLALGGLALGIAVYNRADLVIVIGAAALGLLAARPEIVRSAGSERRKDVATLALPFLLGAAPIIASIRAVLEAVSVLRSRGDLAERLQVLGATLDGSYFHRFMDVGGRFDAIFETTAPAGGFGLALAIGLAVVAIANFAPVGPALAPLRRDPGLRFLAVATAIIGLAMLSLPGATRTHHMLNLCPFAHLLVATAIDRLGWGTKALSSAAWKRRAAVALVGLLVLANVRVIASTRALIEQTGGRGFWSGAISDLADDLEAEAGSSAVSLDWGFHLQLLFLTDGPKLLEPHWRIADVIRARGVWTSTGNAGTRYLVHEDHYDRFEFSPIFLRAIERLDDDRVEIRPYTDREGETAFLAIRVLAPHELSLDRGGEFRFTFR